VSGEGWDGWDRRTKWDKWDKWDETRGSELLSGFDLFFESAERCNGVGVFEVRVSLPRLLRFSRGHCYSCGALRDSAALPFSDLRVNILALRRSKQRIQTFHEHAIIVSAGGCCVDFESVRLCG
jgi:hypothetical protein